MLVYGCLGEQVIVGLVRGGEQEPAMRLVGMLDQGGHVQVDPQSRFVRQGHLAVMDGQRRG